MLRTERPSRLAHACLTLTPRFFAIGLGIAVTGCSADISRFDSPMFGLTESGNRVASAPIPHEGVLSNRSVQRSDPSSYGDTYGSISGSSGAGYRGGSVQASYSPPPFQPSYQPAPSQHAYQPASSYAPKPEQPTRVAALPPSSAADADRPLPWDRQPAAAATPSHKEGRPASIQSAAAGGNEREIEVQPGETLYSLAQRHGASISELMSLNGLRSPVVHPGQKIVLPERPTAVAAAVRRAPSSKSAATRVAALTEPVAAPAAANEQPAAVVRDLTPDHRPAASEAAPQHAETASEPGETYTIRNGESLYGIAVRHRIPLAELQRINNITDPRKIRAGTVLKLPSSSQTPADVASAPQIASQSEPKPATPVQTAAAPAEGAADPAAANPVIINSTGQRVAALEKSDVVSDAAPSPLTLPPPEASSTASEPGKASGSKGTESAKAEPVGKFRWPVRGKVIAGFGDQPDGSHSDGIKLAVPLGTEVHAAESGVVAYAGNELKGYGNLVLLRHDNGWITAYAHNDELSVKRGDRVRRGQVIAKAGNTGSADKPQLHFELRQGSSPVNPIPHLEKL